MNTLFARLEPLVQAADYRLWWVQWAEDKTLQVFIDSEKGIGLDDCEKVSRELSAFLDAFDAELNIPAHYSLQVSSPGADRLLHTHQQCAAYIGQQVQVRMQQPVDERRNWQGELLDADEQTITLQADGRQYSFAWPQTKEVRLVYNPREDFHKR